MGTSKKGDAGRFDWLYLRHEVIPDGLSHARRQPSAFFFDYPYRRRRTQWSTVGLIVAFGGGVEVRTEIAIQTEVGRDLYTVGNCHSRLFKSILSASM
jgi:hypothetical protein